MVLVAVAMVAIIAMAALSIDVVTLYLGREEAQRSADAAALAAARVLSVSGITGTADTGTDNASWVAICGTSGAATQAAQAVATQNTIGSIVATTVNVTYSQGSGINANSDSNCSNLPRAFAVNPMVTVQVIRTSMPTFFSRVWGNTGNSVSATATAEAFNPSDSGNFGNGPSGTLNPVQPRCVKPWVVPNRDPLNPRPNSNGTYCDDQDPILHTTTACNSLVSTTDGSITHPGISLNGTGANGLIGERFWLSPDCVHSGRTCALRSPTPIGNFYPTGGIRTYLQPPPSLQYLPAEAPTAVPVAVPACSSPGNGVANYEPAIGGCDQSTAYQCGVRISASPNPNRIDLDENPGAGTNDTMNGIQCLIHEGDATDPQPDGQDTLGPYAPASNYGSPNAYPFQFLSGTSNPLLTHDIPMTSSSSIVSLPIYDQSAVTINGSGATNITIVGFLQVFINSVDQWGNIDVTVLNIAGCGNNANGTAVSGSSPVPVRLITPP